MLMLITLAFVAVVSVAGAVEYWLWQQRRTRVAADKQDRDQGDQQGISFAIESLACIGAILVLAGSCVLISQRWLHISDTGRVAILATVAICFLIAGFLVRWLTASSAQPVTEIMWCASAACAAGAAAIGASGVGRQSADVTVLTSGAVLAAYSAALWLLCRRELLMTAAFAGLIGALCASTLLVATGAAALLAVALGLWLFGVAWVVLGWVYPDPLGTSLAVGATLALAAPAVAVYDRGWLFAIGIATAAAAMAASVPLQNVVMLAFGSCALFAYITAAVLRCADRSLGIAESLVIIGLSLIGLAVVTARLGLAARPPLTTRADLIDLRSRLASRADRHPSAAPADGKQADRPPAEPVPTGRVHANHPSVQQRHAA
jgi:hypothetical protein